MQFDFALSIIAVYRSCCIVIALCPQVEVVDGNRLAQNGPVSSSLKPTTHACLVYRVRYTMKIKIHISLISI